VTEKPDLRRVELAVVLLGLTVIAAAAPLAVDGFRFHLVHLVAEARGHDVLSADCIVAVVTALVSTVAAIRFFTWLTRAALRQRRGLARLEKTEARADIIVVESREIEAFTAGWAKPRVYVSRGALEGLRPDALAAVIEHEKAHARRRDPLRLAISGGAAHALGWIPGVASVARRQRTVAELAADAYAVRRLGHAAGLADALLAADDRHGRGSGVLPQRVDQLTGELRCDVSRAAVTAGLAVLALLAAVSVVMVSSPAHPAAFCTVAAAVLCPFVAIPAAVAGRRAGRALDAR
jgi:hypothetical protein